jgi:hypothetical protein
MRHLKLHEKWEGVVSEYEPRLISHFTHRAEAMRMGMTHSRIPFSCIHLIHLFPIDASSSFSFCTIRTCSRALFIDSNSISELKLSTRVLSCRCRALVRVRGDAGGEFPPASDGAREVIGETGGVRIQWCDSEVWRRWRRGIGAMISRGHVQGFLVCHLNWCWWLVVTVTHSRAGKDLIKGAPDLESRIPGWSVGWVVRALGFSYQRRQLLLRRKCVRATSQPTTGRSVATMPQSNRSLNVHGHAGMAYSSILQALFIIFL